MIILTLRTDKPESEIGLFDDAKQLTYYTWEAHRQLAETIHLKLQEVLTAQGKNLADIRGIVVYEGPGSFTGLRIGMSVANALAYSLGAPIAASGGEGWVTTGIKTLRTRPSQRPVVPEYGAPVHTTQQKR